MSMQLTWKQWGQALLSTLTKVQILCSDKYLQHIWHSLSFWSIGHDNIYYILIEMPKNKWGIEVEGATNQGQSIKQALSQTSLLNSNEIEPRKDKKILAASIGVGCFMVLLRRWRQLSKVAAPNQYLVKQGMFMKKHKIMKKTVLLPFQSLQTIEIGNHSAELDSQLIGKDLLRVQVKARINYGTCHEMDLLSKFVENDLFSMTFPQMDRLVQCYTHRSLQDIMNQLEPQEFLTDLPKVQTLLEKQLQKYLDDFGLSFNNPSNTDLKLQLENIKEEVEENKKILESIKASANLINLEEMIKDFSSYGMKSQEYKTLDNSIEMINANLLSSLKSDSYDTLSERVDRILKVSRGQIVPQKKNQKISFIYWLGILSFPVLFYEFVYRNLGEDIRKRYEDFLDDIFNIEED